MAPAQRKILFERKLYDRLVSLCVDALPDKAYGIIAGKEESTVTDIFPLTTNLRPENEKINGIFLSYGQFYCDKDRGFWIDKREQFEVLKRIEERGLNVIAIYHSHRCRLATPSQVDVDLHYDPKALALIVSVVNPGKPEVKAFEIVNGQFREAEIVIHHDKQ